MDLRLHRKGPLINDELSTWVTAKQRLLGKYDEQIQVTLTQGFGEEHKLVLSVSRFEPGPNDRTAYFWTDKAGKRRSKEMPPYFISDRAGAREAMYDFLVHARSFYLDGLLANSSRLIWATFDAASRYDPFGKPELVVDAFNLWVASRFIESPWRIVHGAYQMGAEVTYEQNHRYHDFVPVTPIMDTQLDEIVIRDLLVPITTRFLKKLKAKIDERKPEDWLEIHFAVFIMMSNVGWITKDMVAQTTEKGLKPGNRHGTLTCGYIHACKTILSHYHYVCAGPIPFVTFKYHDEGDVNTKNWTPDQRAYVQSLRREYARQTPERRKKIRDWAKLVMYEDDGYWCYQMLDLEWEGNIPHNGEVDDFTEEDFLSSSGTETRNVC
ncbi:hypothetical protein E8E12_009812 [Didymella heteroderae]|uniref:Uncharacterized protein n=1 Tax=Didymella heteroderae TaxID=1769908 RepID=A0A9P4WZM4_9PLEO|nr:hypothetical protein E8E12_009812 [Didymella heteroderae]